MRDGSEFSTDTIDTLLHETRNLRSTATFSKDRLHRYALSRMWTPVEEHDWRRVLVVMGLNPSTADEREDDPTIRRCIDYAKRWGHHGLTMLNLFSYRATDPLDMIRAHKAGVDISGGDIHAAAISVFTQDRRVLCAWGVNGALLDRGPKMIEALRATGCDLVHLGLTQEGHPRHPLYLRADLLPQKL